MRTQTSSRSTYAAARTETSFSYLRHSAGNELPQVFSPLRFNNASLEDRMLPPLLLGQQSDDILRSPGIDDVRIAQLRKQGIV